MEFFPRLYEGLGIPQCFHDSIAGRVIPLAVVQEDIHQFRLSGWPGSRIPKSKQKDTKGVFWEMPTQSKMRNGLSSVGSTAAKQTVWLQWPEKSWGGQCLQPASGMDTKIQ